MTTHDLTRAATPKQPLPSPHAAARPYAAADENSDNLF